MILNQLRMDKFKPRWTKIDQIEQHGTKLNHIGPNWTNLEKMDLNGSKRTKRPNLKKWSKIGFGPA